MSQPSDRNPGKRVAKTLDRVTVRSFVGNAGCIRFPDPIRKVSGIKRDDKLLLHVKNDGTIVLEKSDVVSPESVSESRLIARVSKCSCPEAPAGCAGNEPVIVSVGWSYIQLMEPLVSRLGFAAHTPIQLTAERSRISVELAGKQTDMTGIAPVRCPP